MDSLMFSYSALMFKGCLCLANLLFLALKDTKSLYVWKQILRVGQRNTYRVLHTIQIKLILLSMWAEGKTDLQFKYEI